MNKFLLMRLTLNQFRCLPMWLLVKISSTKDIIIADLERYMELDKIDESKYIAFCILLIRKPEFQTQMVYRLKANSNIFGKIGRLLFKGQSALYINTMNIGSGLYIQHGFATIISAKSIGKNMYVNQQVTIGYEGNEAPIIGDDVRICAGAKVIGGIRVGDRVVVGANAVAVKDIPPDAIVGEVPAHVIHLREQPSIFR